MTALKAAAAGGHLAVVERLLQANIDPNEIKKGIALGAAARGGHLAVVKRLLQEKVDFNVTIWGLRHYKQLEQRVMDLLLNGCSGRPLTPTI
jgi:hypothetical protein